MEEHAREWIVTPGRSWLFKSLALVLAHALAPLRKTLLLESSFDVRSTKSSFSLVVPPAAPDHSEKKLESLPRSRFRLRRNAAKLARRLAKIFQSLKRQRESDSRKSSFRLAPPPAVGRMILERNLGMASQIADGVPVAQPSLAVCRTLWRWSPRAFRQGCLGYREPSARPRKSSVSLGSHKW